MSLLELERRRWCITPPHVTGCALISITPIRATKQGCDMLRLTQPIQYNHLVKSHFTALCVL